MITIQCKNWTREYNKWTFGAVCSLSDSSYTALLLHPTAHCVVCVGNDESDFVLGFFIPHRILHIFSTDRMGSTELCSSMGLTIRFHFGNAPASLCPSEPFSRKVSKKRDRQSKNLRWWLAYVPEHRHHRHLPLSQPLSNLPSSHKRHFTRPSDTTVTVTHTAWTRLGLD